MRLYLLIVVVIGLAPPSQAQELRLFSVGAGDLYGGYYAAAQAICDVSNRAERHRFRCSPEATPGSVYNLVNLNRGQLDLAFAQSDWQEHALKGTSVFAAFGPMKRLRTVMSLYPESFNLIARREAHISGIRDLVGKRLDLGPPSSGRRSTLRAVLDSFGVKPSDFRSVAELPGSDAIDALCAGKIDATVLITGHPRGAINRALSQCAAELVPLAGPEIDHLIAGSPTYSRFVVPKSAYASLDQPVPTFAVRATIVTMPTADDDVIEAFVLNTLANLDRLGQAVPLLRSLDPKSMRSQGLRAPLHPAAVRAFDKFLASSK